MRLNETHELSPNVRFGLPTTIAATRIASTIYRIEKIRFGKREGKNKYAILRDGAFCWLIDKKDGGQEYRPIDLGICKELAIEQLPDFDAAKQSAAVSVHIQDIFHALRNAPEPSAEAMQEMMFEARAAHGPGVELTNILTGKRFTT